MKYSKAVATGCLGLALIGAMGTTVMAQAAEALQPLTLEQLYRAKPYAGVFAAFTPEAQGELDDEPRQLRAADNAPDGASPVGRRTL